MNSKIAQTIYVLGTAIGVVLSLLTLWNVVDAATAANITAAIEDLSKFLGASAVTGTAATAAVRVTKQRADQAVSLDGPTADAAVAVIKATVDRAASAVADQDKVLAAAADALSTATGSLTRQVIDAAATRAPL